MRAVVCCVGISGWYPRGVARLVQKFHEVSNGIDVVAWINAYPPGAPGDVIQDGYNYGPYCAKPFALRHLRDQGADIGILCDAAFYPTRHIKPLVDHVENVGYYLCENGFQMGEWCSDVALETLGLTRDEALAIPEVSSYAVGLNFHHDAPNKALDEWCRLAADGRTFPGPHTQTGGEGRNQGHVSNDPRVRGHRHDQTSLSAIAWRLGMHERVHRPKFTAYDGSQDEATVLINRGGM